MVFINLFLCFPVCIVIMFSCALCLNLFQNYMLSCCILYYVVPHHEQKVSNDWNLYTETHFRLETPLLASQLGGVTSVTTLNIYFRTFLLGPLLKAHSVAT